MNQTIQLDLFQETCCVSQRGRSEMQPFKFPNPKFTELKNRIHLSFSGGKTSAYMTKMVLDYFREHSPETEIQVVFANTGQEHPEMFAFPARMEEQYGFAGGERRDGEERKRRVFFRGNRTTQDILAAAQQPFEPFHDERFVPYDEEMDAHGSCGDSCEIGADKNDL